MSSKSLTCTSIEVWLEKIGHLISADAPELSSLFNIYVGEARFGRKFIEADLSQLPRNAAILEVGAGSLLLSCQLVLEGYTVTALEPISYGFSHFSRMQELILDKAIELGCAPTVINEAAENLSILSRFDYAFSVNVMEHVDDVETSIRNVVRSLKSGAIYHFTCPNYLFPYESHFNIPIVVNKKLTGKIFSSVIFGASSPPDASGLWDSINWISVIELRRIAKSTPSLTMMFGKRQFSEIMERVISDAEFARRRPKWMRLGISVVVISRLHFLFRYVPALFQPTIDCVVFDQNRKAGI